MLNKSEVVLYHDPGAATLGEHYYRTPDDLDGVGVFLPYGLAQDMGTPDQITVTIEPGDRLNQED